MCVSRARASPRGPQVGRNPGSHRFGVGGQVVLLYAERVVETQIHLEDCLHGLKQQRHTAAERVQQLASSLQAASGAVRP